MGQDNFRIQISDDLVDVAWDDARSVGNRLFLCLISCGFGAGMVYGSLFQHGKRPGLLVSLHDDSELFKAHVGLLYLNVIAVVLVLAVGVYLFALGIRNLFSSGDRLHCDHSTFTISKIAFWSFGDRWVVQSVLPSEVSQARYGVVQSGRGGRVYGILANVRGKSWKVFSGIDVSDAKRVLQGLNRMGVDVRFSDEMSLEQST